MLRMLAVGLMVIPWAGCEEEYEPHPRIAEIEREEAEARARRIAEKNRRDAERVIIRDSVAVFEGKDLDQCLEVHVRVEGVRDPAKRAELAKHVGEDEFTEALGEGAVKIDAPCEQQFHDRAVLATCAHSLTRDKKGLAESPLSAGSSAVISMTARYYRYETIGKDDREMQTCLSDGGKWTAVDRDSRAWRRAKLRALDKKLDRLR